MNPKALWILLAATGVIVLLAVLTQRSVVGDGGEPLPERVVPDLEQRINEVAAIRIASGGEQVTLERRDGAWVVASSAGYPAKFETVKQALVSLAELEPRERKTADPARYGRIGLGEPEEGSDSVGVVLLDDAGGEIASVVLGDEVTAGGTPQRYVRTAASEQSWLAEGRVTLPTDQMQWMEREVLRIGRDRVARVTITHPDGEAVAIVREEGGANYALEALPEGREPRSPGEVGAPASALSFLRFDDVRSASDPGFEPGEPTVTVFETESGLVIRARTWEYDGTVWAAFAAEAPEAADASAGEADAAEGQAAEPTEPEQPEDQTPQAEATEINERLGRWLFAIPDHQAAPLRKRLADLTTEPEPPAPDEAVEGDPEGEPVFVPSLDARDDPGGG